MAPTDRIDLYKQHKDQYVARKTPTLVTINEAVYLSIDGRGAPGGPEFVDKIGSLYAMAYTVKMTRKFAGQQDYVVCKLEAIWWTDEPGQTFETVSQDLWSWKLMIRTPDFVEPAELEQAAETLLAKGKAPAAPEVRLERLSEGLCVQALHVGPYDQEGQTVEKMAAFASDNGYTLDGRHHEIYLSDPRRVAPEKLKTILRCPVR